MINFLSLNSVYIESYLCSIQWILCYIINECIHSTYVISKPWLGDVPPAMEEVYANIYNSRPIGPREKTSECQQVVYLAYTPTIHGYII